LNQQGRIVSGAEQNRLSTKPKQAIPTIEALADASDGFRPEAFAFLRDGLDFAARQIHGSFTPAQIIVHQYMVTLDIDYDELSERHQAGMLDEAVAAAIECIGGVDRVNRNVGGGELCWRLRDYGRKRFGRLASCVLRSWGVSTTRHFGEIVFLMVEHGMMQKESRDSISDFDNVYDFRAEFEQRYPVFE
jgi:uncharacterized repeat protein (TIGR04138 family)